MEAESDTARTTLAGNQCSTRRPRGTAKLERRTRAREATIGEMAQLFLHTP